MNAHQRRIDFDSALSDYVRDFRRYRALVYINHDGILPNMVRDQLRRNMGRSLWVMAVYLKGQK